MGSKEGWDSAEAEQHRCFEASIQNQKTEVGRSTLLFQKAEEVDMGRPVPAATATTVVLGRSYCPILAGGDMGRDTLQLEDCPRWKYAGTP